MLYIFVGPDGAGKTTCFDSLKELFANASRRAIFIKESYTSDELVKSGRVKRLCDLKEHTGNVPVVYDRATLIDDVIYRPVLDGKPSLFEQRSVYNALFGCTVIFVTATKEVLLKRLQARGDRYLTDAEAQLDAILERYNTFIRGCEENSKLGLMSVHTIDTTHLSELQTQVAALNLVDRKTMKFAHIVPEGSLEVLREKQYLMCLAHLVKDNERYRQFYAHARARGSFVLMDNGAAEGQQLSNDELLECYKMIQPSEIVVPDTLCDGPDTVRKTRKALALFQAHHLPYRFMAVPQGNTIDEWAKCAEELVCDGRINSIGVSKFLQIATGDKRARYHAMQILKDLLERYSRPDIEVHLLGCSEPLSVIGDIAKDFPFVRGCDSAIGYLFAQAGVHPLGNTERPAGEIDFVGGADHEGLSEYLTDVELAAGIYDNYKGDRSWTL